VAKYVRRNLLLGMEAGVRYIPTGYALLAPKLVLQFLKTSHWHNGRPPFYAAGGGTSPLSCLGQVSAALELKEQIDAGILPEPDYLYVALGSLGTAAGLAVGCRLAGLRTKLVGVVVSYRWYCTAARWAGLARRIHRLMRRFDPGVPNIAIDKSALSVVPTALGRGYARFTEPSVRLAQDMQTAEMIELDGTYTAKTLHGAMMYIHKRKLQDDAHLFWHTYQAARLKADSEEAIALLPGPLRRYFSQEAQPLDAW
jgi:D-cysteine desulfhydrase